jgi:hypothetical protein
MVGDIISERRAELSRNGGRHHSGIVGDIDRNPQPNELGRGEDDCTQQFSFWPFPVLEGLAGDFGAAS